MPRPSSQDWGLPGGPVVEISPASAEGSDLILGQGAKILHASQPKKKKKNHVKQKQILKQSQSRFF